MRRPPPPWRMNAGKVSVTMRWHRIWLLMSLAAFFVHISRKAIISYTGLDVTFGFSLVGTFFLALAIHGYRRQPDWRPVATSFSAHLGVFVAMIALLSVAGYFRSHILDYIGQDAMVLLIIAMAIYVGRSDQFWRDLHGPMLLMFWVGFVIVVANLRRGSVNIGLEGTSVGGTFEQNQFRDSVWSLGYDLQPYLSYWPVLFAVAYD